MPRKQSHHLKSFNEYNVFDYLEKSARSNRGRQLGPLQVKQVLGTVNNMLDEIHRLEAELAEYKEVPDGSEESSRGQADTREPASFVPGATGE